MAKLTRQEAAWIKKLLAVLDECPSDRMEAYTTGDPNITIFDKTLEPAIQQYLETNGADWCQGVDHADAELVRLRMPFQVHSTSG